MVECGGVEVIVVGGVECGGGMGVVVGHVCRVMMVQCGGGCGGHHGMDVVVRDMIQGSEVVKHF